MADPTAEQIQRRIIEELEAVAAKLPWWQAALIGAGLLGVVLATIMACVAAKAACVAGTGGLGTPACMLAFIKCLLAAFGLIVALIMLIVKLVAVNGEDKAIEAKKTQLEQLQQQQGH